MRVTSKKKRPPEPCVEKPDMSPANDSSIPSFTSSLNSGELCELQELLRQKRSEIELQQNVDGVSVTVEDVESLQAADVQAGIYCTVTTEFLVIQKSRVDKCCCLQFPWQCQRGL